MRTVAVRERKLVQVHTAGRVSGEIPILILRAVVAVMSFCRLPAYYFHTGTELVPEDM